MEANILDSTGITDMEKESTHFLIRTVIGAFGSKINLHLMASMSMLLAKGTKESLSMARNMAKESTTIAVELYTKESGTRIGNMALEPLSIPIMRDMKAIG